MHTTTQEPLFIAGEPRATEDSLTVRSPYDGEQIATVAVADEQLVAEAIDRAAAALAEPFPTHARIRVLQRTSEALERDAETFARTIAQEAGKAIRTARAEVKRAASTFRFAAAEASRLEGEVLTLDAAEGGEGRLGFTIVEPIGVIGAIAPFNFPLNLVAHKLAPAIAAGCSVVLKPAGTTPLTSLLLARTLKEQGLPDGYLSVVTGKASMIGDALIEDERVRFITFTGSAQVGWGIRARAARKDVALELGNNSPSIVAADADLEDAAAKLAANAFVNAGQACISVQRIIVDARVHDAFVAQLVPRAEALVTGDPLDERTDVGPLIDERERDRVVAWIAEAVAEGAEVLAGGEVVDGVLRPTVLGNVDPRSKVSCEEVFGPVVSIERCDGVADGLARANASTFGLQASIFTADLGAAFEAARELRYAGVLVNEAPTYRLDQMPYGGIKDSGNTREGPRYALEHMIERKLVIVSPGTPAPAVDAAREA